MSGLRVVINDPRLYPHTKELQEWLDEASKILNEKIDTDKLNRAKLDLMVYGSSVLCVKGE